MVECSVLVSGAALPCRPRSASVAGRGCPQRIQQHAPVGGPAGEPPGLGSLRRVWQALQEVGDALAEAQRATKNAEAGGWRERNQRHWTIASIDEVRTALRGCKFSLRVVSAQAKRFEPQLIEKDWRR